MRGIIRPLCGLRTFLLPQDAIRKHGRPEHATLVKQVTSEGDTMIPGNNDTILPLMLNVCSSERLIGEGVVGGVCLRPPCSCPSRHPVLFTCCTFPSLPDPPPHLFFVVHSLLFPRVCLFPLWFVVFSLSIHTAQFHWHVISYHANIFLCTYMSLPIYVSIRLPISACLSVS